MERISRMGLLSFLVLLLPLALWAGAWPQPKGHYFFKLDVSYLSTDEEFNFQADKIPILGDFPGYGNVEFRDLAVTFYGEYGITSRLTGIVTLPFKRSTNERVEELIPGQGRSVTRTTSGLSDLRLMVRYGLLQLPVAVSLQGGVKIPLGYDEFPDNDGPSLGTSKVDTELSLLIGKSFFPLPIYAWGGGGYRRRSGRFNDEFIFTGEVGLTLGRALVKFNVDGIKNTKRPPDIYGETLVLPLPGGGGAFQQFQFGDQDVIKINPGVIVDVSGPLAFQVDVIHVVWGRNMIAGTTASAGLVLHR
ncbi:MAG: hypothetical protein D6715_04625 [Calditrichaeota bacterium]|nr:MAG: hypothetical protein D6715_04625 [Calditrichota bacterium]